MFGNFKTSLFTPTEKAAEAAATAPAARPAFDLEAPEKLTRATLALG